MAGALGGIAVLDLSRFLAGPLRAMMLADLGADVVTMGLGKRRGEGTRHRGGQGP